MILSMFWTAAASSDPSALSIRPSVSRSNLARTWSHVMDVAQKPSKTPFSPLITSPPSSSIDKEAGISGPMRRLKSSFGAAVTFFIRLWTSSFTAGNSGYSSKASVTLPWLRAVATTRSPCARAFLVISVPKPRDTPVLNQTVRSATLASFEEVVPLSRRETARY